MNTRRGFKPLYLLLILTALSANAFGQASVPADGNLDTSFSASAFGASSGTVNAVKVQPDGKILVGGVFTEANGFAATGIARLNADGSTDTSFSAPDFANSSGLGREIRTIALQADGKILVGGFFSGVDNQLYRGLARLNADGSLDTSFNGFGLPADSYVSDIEVQPDNKILVGGGGTGFGLLRLNADGTLDNTFLQFDNGNNGVEDIELQADGKIVIVGRNNMKRFTSNGTLDPNFNQSNIFTSGTNTSVKVRPDGKILVGGSFMLVNGIQQRRLCLFDSAGSPDTTFSAHGPDAEVRDIILKPDGKILIAGAFTNYDAIPRKRIAQLNADGSFDITVQFAIPSDFISVNDLELQPDGKILAGLNVSAARFNADGTIDSTFAPQLTFGGTVKRILQQPDGKILVAGEFLYADGVQRNHLARFNADGSLDTSFVPFFNNQTSLQITSLALRTDGKILVAAGNLVIRLNPDGTMDFSVTVPQPLIYDIVSLANGQILIGGWRSGGGFILRLQESGAVDTTFTPPQLGGEVYKILALPDGKILIGGQFSGIRRLNPDGSLDNTFQSSTNGVVYDMDLQPDGKVIVGGSFTTLNGSDNQRTIGRLNADGTLDTSFVQSTNGVVYAVKIQPDGKILIGGAISGVQGAPHNGIARLNSDGSIDSAFNTYANTSVSDINLQSDGKILIVGGFTKINRISAVRVARLLNSVPNARTLFDFDGDGKADISIFRPSENRWYILRSSDGQVSQQVFAIAGDIPVPADYDGDGKTDVAVYRPSSADWWSLSTANGNQVYAHWGQSGDIPRPSDFDGDGKSDYIFFLPANSTWYRYGSSAGASYVTFGLSGDKPVTGDFDGDGKSDVAIFRPSTGDWWWQSSVDNAQRATHWGISTDVPSPADYDGDGKTDFAVYRPSTGTWYIYNSATNSSTILNFGIAEDKPVAADYDGDGRADIAVFRPSTGVWYLLRSTAGFTAQQFGISTDVPVPNAYIP